MDIKAVRPVEAKTVYIVFIHLFFHFFFEGREICLLLTWSTVWSDYLGSWQLLKHHTHPNVTPYFNLLFETHIKMHKKQGAKLWCNKMKFQSIRQQQSWKWLWFDREALELKLWMLHMLLCYTNTPYTLYCALSWHFIIITIKFESHQNRTVQENMDKIWHNWNTCGKCQCFNAYQIVLNCMCSATKNNPSTSKPL